ncbi:hypothetical protein [Streptomyces spongiae]|uniref:Uncharacterized protein n=1 Tax=Streptomyces spongiae TaxID=565072 RepID=A0A5N8XSR6_9ACTN|nr:hypothetical protein [Streptomyces spongiae]MPY62451.1 hypothetical protein [Streptomyces spongiae]
MDKPTNTRSTTRLLPWSGVGGKPCHLLTDDNGGYLTRLADSIESVQLGMGSELLDHAQELVNDPKTGPAELRYLSARLTESLRDVLRVAESRGARLPMPDDDDADDNSDGSSAALNDGERSP